MCAGIKRCVQVGETNMKKGRRILALSINF
jgi:hypothetical protein